MYEREAFGAAIKGYAIITIGVLFIPYEFLRNILDLCGRAVGVDWFDGR